MMPFLTLTLKVCHIAKLIKFLTRFRLGLNQLCQHKFKHSFQNTLNPINRCSNVIETKIHYPPLLQLF